MDRNQVVNALGPKVAEHLSHLESITSLAVVFEPLPEKDEVVARYRFDPGKNIPPTVLLKSGFAPCDVDHELMHMEMELVDGYNILAWRRGINPTPSVEAAVSRIRNYVDDEVVFSRLLQSGYELDGEVLKPQFFDDICKNVKNKLNKLKPRSQDGMTHLDHLGYGELCRSSFLVRAERVLETYGEKLNDDRCKKLKRFIVAFRLHRSAEAGKADQILGIFRKYDVFSIEGHKNILSEWSSLEHLDSYVGVSVYQRRGSFFTLPYP